MADLRVLLVDDEPLVRRGLRAHLAKVPDVTIVAECRDGLEAVSAIREHAPDLVFLDVQMPELDGFGVVETIGPDHMPAVVFVTAFDEYALRAFDVHAVDYLLKPFDAQRFHVALERGRARVAAAPRSSANESALAALLAEVRGQPEYPDRILVKGRDRVIVVNVSEIEFVDAADNYVRIHTASGRHLVRETIKAMESRLDPRRFLRVHRSTIVNVAKVRELRPLFSGESAIVLQNGTSLTLSRTYREAFERRFGRPI
jgi:two-component system LytT family response regulator